MTKVWKQPLSEDQRTKPLFEEACKGVEGLGWERLNVVIANPAAYSVEYISSLPIEWRERYKSCQYAKIDPNIPMALGAKKPYLLKTEDCPKLSPADDIHQLVSEAIEFGIKTAAGVPVQKVGPLIVGMTAVTSEKFSSRSIEALNSVVTELSAELKKVLFPRPPDISEREIEVLYWVAAGKTAEEISIILGIKTRTVQFHVQSLKEKLNASTQAHLVSIAHQMALI
jgi:DNA-binding CsgD family transcriptional regulator